MTTPTTDAGTPVGSAQDAMALLRSGVPLSLLLDLALGPRSAELFRDEPDPARPWWAPAA